MTDGVHARSLPIGDQNFLEHSTVEAKLATAWREVRLPRALSAASAALAEGFAYELQQAASAALPLPAQTRRVETMISLGSLELCISSWGESKLGTVLCLHGYGDQGPVWECVAQELVAAGYRVIAPDLRGHGLSAPTPATQLVDFVVDIAGLCEELRLSELSIVAHSMGTMLASVYAALFPARVLHLHLVEPIVPLANRGRVRERLQRSLTGRQGQRTQASFASEAEAIRRFSSLHPTMPAELVEPLAKRILQQSSAGVQWRSDAGTLSIVDWLSREDYLSLLAELDVPTALYFGDDSDRIREEAARALRAALPSAVERSMRETHNVHYERPSEIAQAIALEESKRLRSRSA